MANQLALFLNRVAAKNDKLLSPPFRMLRRCRCCNETPPLPSQKVHRANFIHVSQPMMQQKMVNLPFLGAPNPNRDMGDRGEKSRNDA